MLNSLLHSSILYCDPEGEPFCFEGVWGFAAVMYGRSLGSSWAVPSWQSVPYSA
jgi:hypothetical protein